MTYQIPVPTRVQWRQLRDRHHVPAGASKASIGDSIDAVHKTFTLKTLTKHQQALAKLQADTDVYLAAIKKKHAAFVPVFTKEVKKQVVDHSALVDDVVKAKGLYNARYAAVVSAVRDLRLQGTGSTKDVATAMTALLGCVAAFNVVEPARWNGRRKALNLLMVAWEQSPTPTPDLYAQAQQAMRDLKM